MTDGGDCGPMTPDLPSVGRRTARRRINRDELWRLLELATGVEPSAALVAALHEASRGHSEPAVALLGELVAEGRSREAQQAHVFRREGEYWTIGYESQVIRLRDAKGLHYLGSLLRRPGEPVNVTELAGRGGDDRASVERARLAVTRAIKIALVHIAAAHPGLGRHLTATVRRGYRCVYLPDPRTPIAWTG